MRKPISKNSLLATTLIAGLAFATPAIAQNTEVQSPPSQDPNVQAAPTDQTPATQENVADTPAQDNQDVEQGAQETIVVTGSRIVSPNIRSQAPVQVVGETEIDQSGALNVQEILLENPVFGTPALSRTNSAFLTSGAGVATVDLRDLGSDRTLVLINSRRVIAGLPGSATVDLNMIPTQFVERIDILTGGASSLYGSDAVAGVVNFIYKRNFEGLLAEAQTGITERGDSRRSQLSLTGGGNFLDERGNLMVHLGYTKEEGLLSRARKNTRQDDLSEFLYTYDPDDFGVSRQPFNSSFTPQGRFRPAPGRQFSFDPNTGELFPCFSSNAIPTCTGVNGGAATAPFGFNRQFFRTLAVPVERYLFATRGTFEVTDAINIFVEGTYSKTKAERQIEPFPLDSADLGNGGIVDIESFVDGVAVRNPFVPNAIFAVATDKDGNGLRDLTFTRRLTEVGPRSSRATRDIFRIVTGIEGSVLDGRFNWDLSYNYGETSESQTSNGQFNVQNLRAALAGVPDVNDLNNNGSTNDVVCADPIQVELGCVPVNIFGVGSITPEALAFIEAQQDLAIRVTQQVVSGNVSGSIVELPAGPLGVALGAEYRRETSREDQDALTNAGLNGGNKLPDTKGDFDVKEVFGEVNVPILADRPFFHQLNLRAAGRLSDYSTVGSVKTYNVGADWAPFEALRMRGTYARSVRAPNIGELFTGPSQTFPSGLTDPCQGVTLTSTGASAANCRAAPGVLANIQENGGVFTLTQPDIQGISGFDSGNPDLDVEKSKSITAGVVFAPRNIAALRNLVLSADYYNISIDDAIIAPPRQFLLEQCFEQGDPFACSLITRRPQETGANSAGSIEFIDAPLVNGGTFKVKGFDVVAQYRAGLDRFISGVNMNARLAWTHILDAYLTPVPGGEKDPFDQEIGTARDRVNASIGFNTDKFGLSVTGNYIGKSYEDNTFLEGFDLEKDAIVIPAQFYLDTQVTFTPTRNFEFFFGVDNLLDNDAPKILNGTTFNTTGSDTAADVYDIFGRRYYAGVRLRM